MKLVTATLFSKKKNKKQKTKKKLATATRVGILFYARAAFENNSYYLINKSNEPTNFLQYFSQLLNWQIVLGIQYE